MSNYIDDPWDEIYENSMIDDTYLDWYFDEEENELKENGLEESLEQKNIPDPSNKNYLE